MDEMKAIIPEFTVAGEEAKEVESVTTSAALMTDDEVKQLSESLKDEKSAEILAAAQKETEETNYEELEYIDIPTLTEVDTTVGETEKNYTEVFSDYGVSSEETKTLFALIAKFKSGVDMNYYEPLPKAFKDIADGIRAMGLKTNSGAITKNQSAKILLAEVVRDAQVNKAFDDFNAEMQSTVNEMNSEYNKIFSDAFEDVFNRIDEIEASDPEQAAKIKEVKTAFEDAINLTRLKEFIASVSPKKLTKWTTRYKDEVNYFNTKVNVTEVKIPDIGELAAIIYFMNTDLDLEDIKKFIVAICRSAYTMDVKNNIGDLAYLYRLVNTIYSYKFVNNPDDDNISLLFKNVAEVIRDISASSKQ